VFDVTASFIKDQSPQQKADTGEPKI